MKILYIINPVSNGGRTKKIEKFLREWPYPEGTEVQIRETKGPGEGREIARAEAVNFDVVCSVGGDGTLNEVASGLYEAGAGVLGIIPTGTGNDTMKSLGWSDDINEAVKRVVYGQVKEIDAGLADGHFFINIASIGFDAMVVKGTEKIKTKVKNESAYTLSLIKTFFTYRNIDYVELGSDEDVSAETSGFLEESEEGNMGHAINSLFLFAVGNGRYYGGGFQVLPQAEFDDGYLDVCVVQNISRPKLMLLFPSIFKAKHAKHIKYVTMKKVKDYTVKPLEDFLLNLDGELVNYPANTRIRFQVQEKVLRLMQ